MLDFKPQREVNKLSEFLCFLDNQPDLLVPQHLLKKVSGKFKRLQINPHFWAPFFGPAPKEIQQLTHLTTDFSKDHEIIWIGNPYSKNLDPFWIGSEYSGLIMNCKPDEPNLLDLPLKILKALIISGVLQKRNESKEFVAINNYYQKTLSNSSLTFSKYNYVRLSNLIHPYHIGSLRRFYRQNIRLGKLMLGDKQSPFRYVSYNDNILKFFHYRLLHILNRIVGKPIKPSYVYLASYQEGAELPKHVDREQCEYSITFCLDYSPEPKFQTPWPIKLDLGKKVVTVFQRIGDGLLYRGRQIPHYRDKLNPNHSSTSIFFHYVDEAFRGSLR